MKPLCLPDKKDIKIRSSALFLKGDKDAQIYNSCLFLSYNQTAPPAANSVPGHTTCILKSILLISYLTIIPSSYGMHKA